jgi:hypothetical protein
MSSFAGCRVFFWLAKAEVKAKRTEFIWSLDGRSSQQ